MLTDKQLQDALKVIEEKKGHDPILLNLQGISTVTDYFLIVTGNTTTQVKAITDNLLEKLPKCGVSVLHVEGLPEAKWVLIDAGDLVIHVMIPDQRDFYHLERLWGDAKEVSFSI
ncbi:ribosome silencing factor [Desulfitobacterium sp.]|uniref:ribosome silencing factor n=1 Tax=Desulfitobacterium sp. TaxID=49981 RepID=UPI002B207883|nr:ribosome silencing factor [Desulfitobacterium sp.]MEA4902307.1 ribosome silencing factor [Desulfitobacterium sp.]